MSSSNARPYLVPSEARPLSDADEGMSRLADGVLVACLCLLLGFGPIAFGAVQDWARFTLEAGAAACLLLWAASRLLKRRLQVHSNPLFVPVALFAALVAIQLLTGKTAYWYATWRTALLWMAYAIVLFVTVQALRRTAWIKAFTFFLVVFGCLVAIFAIVQQFTWNGNLYWVVPNRYGGFVYGPYVDHAHYAGLMEMLVPVPLVFCLMSGWPRPARILFGFAALLMAATIFLSRSLGGILAFAAQMVVLGVIIGFGERSRRNALTLFALGVLLTAFLVTLSPGGISNSVARLHHPLSKDGAADRIAIARDSMRMVAARPILGWGFGTFSDVYPSYRSFSTNFVVNAAHNDYIQTAVETGTLGFAILCSFIVLFYRAGIVRVRHWRTDVRSASALAAFVGVSGILVHSFSDFNLQIPANAALFFALAALATGSSTSTLADHWT